MESWEEFSYDMRKLLEEDPHYLTGLGEAELLDKRWNAFIEESEVVRAGGRAAISPHTRLRSEYDEPASRDAALDLTKFAGDRRRFAIKQWLASQLAIGKTLGELISHAERFDQPTALLLKECAAELQ